MKRFEEEKIHFSLESHDVKIDLPDPLKRLTIEGRVQEGSLTIYKYGNLQLGCEALLMEGLGTKCEGCSIPASTGL